MKLAMNTVTLRPAPFVGKLGLIAEAGFSGVGLWMADVQAYLREPGAIPIRELLDRHGLTCVEMHSFHEWTYRSGLEREAVLDEVNQFLEKFKELDLDCPVVAVAPYEMEGDIDTAARDLRDLCTIAQRYGARLMFESVCWSKQFGHLAPSWELVRRANCTNGGLLIDTFHLVKSGDPIDDLREIPPEKVFLVHVSDAKPLSMDFMAQSRRFRFLPGSGEAPLRQMLANLREAGYDGFYCLEIFNKEYWRGDLRQLAIASRKALADLCV